MSTVSSRLLWEGKAGANWHRVQLQRYTDNPDRFLIHQRQVITEVADFLNAFSYDYVVEIGCSNGHTIEKVSSIPSSPARFVGLDIDQVVIQRNRERLSNSTVRYMYCTIQDFIRHTTPKSLLVYSIGTLTYFTKQELVNTLGYLTNVPRGAFVLFERFASDLEADIPSRYGGGVGFFHNYPLYLKWAGFDNIEYKTSTDRDEEDLHILASGTWGS